MKLDEETTFDRTSFLSFRLKNELFAVEVKNVIEILDVPKITSVPKSDPYMKGVINLRGKVLPVIDTCLKFDLPEISLKKETCIIVINININQEVEQCGILVDEVLEVFERDKSDIQPSPNLEAKKRNEFVEGVLKIEEEFLILLDLDKAFSIDEFQNVKSIDESPIVN